MGLDEIRIRGLRIFAHHGVFQEETRLGQTFVVNATLYTSTRKGGWMDSLEDTISYADVCLFLTDYLQKNTWKLLEAAVEHTCRALLQAKTTALAKFFFKSKFCQNRCTSVLFVKMII